VQMNDVELTPPVEIPPLEIAPIPPTLKDADVLIEEIAHHLRHFVKHDLPVLERQGHDFAVSVKHKFSNWLAEADAYLAAESPVEVAPTVES